MALKLVTLLLVFGSHYLSNGVVLPTYETRSGFFIVHKKVIRGPYADRPVFTKYMCDCIALCTGDTTCVMFYWIATLGGLNCFTRDTVPDFHYKYQDHDFGGYGFPMGTKSPVIEADGYAYFLVTGVMPYEDQKQRCQAEDISFRVGKYSNYARHRSVLDNYQSIRPFWVNLRMVGDDTYRWGTSKNFNSSTYGATFDMTVVAGYVGRAYYEGNTFKNTDPSTGIAIHAVLCQGNPLGVE